jgi:hypothetical protein
MDEYYGTPTAVQVRMAAHIRMRGSILVRKLLGTQECLPQIANTGSAQVGCYGSVILNFSSEDQAKRLNDILPSWAFAQPVRAFFDSSPLETCEKTPKVPFDGTHGVNTISSYRRNHLV